jgi:hypothetical protein
MAMGASWDDLPLPDCPQSRKSRRPRVAFSDKSAAARAASASKSTLKSSPGQRCRARDIIISISPGHFNAKSPKNQFLTFASGSDTLTYLKNGEKS